MNFFPKGKSNQSCSKLPSATRRRRCPRDGPRLRHHGALLRTLHVGVRGGVAGGATRGRGCLQFYRRCGRRWRRRWRRLWGGRHHSLPRLPFGKLRRSREVRNKKGSKEKGSSGVLCQWSLALMHLLSLLRFLFRTPRALSIHLLFGKWTWTWKAKNVAR